MQVHQLGVVEYVVHPVGIAFHVRLAVATMIHVVPHLHQTLVVHRELFNAPGVADGVLQTGTLSSRSKTRAPGYIHLPDKVLVVLRRLLRSTAATTPTVGWTTVPSLTLPL